MKFIGDNFSLLKGLDIGDLDFIHLNRIYDLIKSYEIIEYLFNPLFYLKEVKRAIFDKVHF